MKGSFGPETKAGFLLGLNWRLSDGERSIRAPLSSTAQESSEPRRIFPHRRQAAVIRQSETKLV
jgi:hypothetical protein